MDLSRRRSGYLRGSEGKLFFSLWEALLTLHMTRNLTLKFRLPLDIVQLTIAELTPKVQELQANGSRASSTAAILDLLRSANLSHVLPPLGPLAPRKFQVSALPQIGHLPYS